MSNTMAAHEPINYLDSILNEEEKRCEYDHQWRNFTISRSGRFKSKNKKRDVVDGKLFDTTTINKDESCRSNNNSNCNVTNASYTNKEQDKHITRPLFNTTAQNKSFQQQNTRGIQKKTETYKSYYETNL